MRGPASGLLVILLLAATPAAGTGEPSPEDTEKILYSMGLALASRVPARARTP